MNKSDDFTIVINFLIANWKTIAISVAISVVSGVILLLIKQINYIIKQLIQIPNPTSPL